MKPRLLCLTPHAPAPDLGHAGGVLLHHRLMALRSCFQVTVVAPLTRQNARVAHVHDVLLVDPDRPRSSARVLASSALGDIRGGGPSISQAVSHDPRLRRMLTAQDAVEVHWGQQLPLVPLVRDAAPRATVGVVLHDIVSEVWRGRVRNGLVWLPERVAYRIGHRRLSQSELALLHEADVVFVLKRQDQHSLTARGLERPVLVVSPWLDRPAPAPGPGPEPVVLFVGALWREENAEAARWLLDRVWPLVVARVPDASLRLVGDRPPASVSDHRVPRTLVTGYVEDLGSEYRAARVVVAPLTTTTGLKVKVPQAMAYGLPVVARPPALAGVPDAPPDAFGGSTDDPVGFANAVVRLLEDRALAVEVGRRAAAWVQDRFSVDCDVAEAMRVYPAAGLSAAAPTTSARDQGA